MTVTTVISAQGFVGTQSGRGRAEKNACLSPFFIPQQQSSVVESPKVILFIYFPSSFFLLQVGESRNVTAADTLMDLARNLLPPNLIQVSKRSASIVVYEIALWKLGRKAENVVSVGKNGKYMATRQDVAQ